MPNMLEQYRHLMTETCEGCNVRQISAGFTNTIEGWRCAGCTELILWPVVLATPKRSRVEGRPTGRSCSTEVRSVL